MPERVDLGFAVTLPPEQAIRYFEAKGYAITWNWHETLQEANARAFTVARATRLDVLSDLYFGVAQSLREGKTERWFQQQLEPLLRQKGWWGKVQEIGADGTARSIQLGSPHRLRTIYRTNLQTAYMAGRWEANVRNAEARPYWMYVAVLDARTRPAHRALNGRVFRWDDPIWQHIHPPNGFNCRCRIRALSERALQRLGLDVESSEGRVRTREVDVSVDRRTGEVIRTEVTGLRGLVGDDGRPTTFWPDPGWSYNPGRAHWLPELDRYPTEIARQYVQGVVTGPEFSRSFKLARLDLDRYIERELGPGPHSNQATRDAAQDLSRIIADRTREAYDRAGLQHVPVTGGQEFPIAILSAAERRYLGTESQTVLLSSRTLISHLGAHPEIGLGDYQKVNDLIRRGEIYAHPTDAGQKIILLEQDGVFFEAVIRADNDRRRNHLLTLFMVSPRTAAKARAKLKRIR